VTVSEEEGLKHVLIPLLNSPREKKKENANLQTEKTGK